MTTIGVLGATGVYGRMLVPRLVTAGYEVLRPGAAARGGRLRGGLRRGRAARRHLRLRIAASSSPRL